MMVRARDVLVRMRVVAVNAVRGLAKPCGSRLPPCSTPSFAKPSLAVLPPELLSILRPLLEQIQSISEQIKIYDRQILELSRNSYPETKMLETVNGIGNLTAITYILTIHDPHRFQKSREVGRSLGLRPRRDQSGDHDPQLGITKAGNGYLRKLLTEQRTTSWVRSGKTVPYGDRDNTWQPAEERMQESERWSLAHESSRCCFITFG